MSVTDFRRMSCPGMEHVDALLRGEAYLALFNTENEAEPEVKTNYKKYKYPTPQVDGAKFMQNSHYLQIESPQ